MSGYSLEFKEAALKDVQKIDRQSQKRIIKKLKFFLYQVDPLSLAAPLQGKFEGQYRWRVGNYRIVFDVDGTTILVLRIQHRREVYRR